MATIEIIPESIQLTRMSDEEYFSDKYKDYLSNSKLGLLNPAQDGSVEKFKTGFKSSYSEAFELGSAVHCLLLQPDDFKISDLEKPTGKLGLFVLAVYAARRKGMKLSEAIEIAKVEADYYVKSLTANRIKTAISKGLDFYMKKLRQDRNRYVSDEDIIYLSKPMKEKFMKCMTSARNDAKFMGKLNPECLIVPNESFNEYAILCDLKVTLDDGSTHKLKIKGKLDNFTLDHEMGVITLNDLKTTGRPIRYFMGNYVNGEWISGSFQKFHYYRQMGLYLWLLNAAIKQTRGLDYELKANLLLVETIPEHNTKVCKVNGIHIERGLDEFKKLIIYLIENGQY